MTALAPDVLSAYANDLVRVLGGSASFEPPGDARARTTIRNRVRALLNEMRPQPDGPSVGEALADLIGDAQRGWADRSGASRRLAELVALFEQDAFRRTKRAERGRLLAQLVVLFELEPATGLGPAFGGDTPLDSEAHLKLVRRRLNGRA